MITYIYDPLPEVAKTYFSPDPVGVCISINVRDDS